MLKTVRENRTGGSILGKRPLRLHEQAAVQSFDSLSHGQLLVYAGELAEHFRKETGLRRALAERERRIHVLAAASIASQEEERQWIACEVHDRLAQTLVSAFQQVQTLESMACNEPKVRQVAIRTSALLRESIREARNIMNELYSPLLDEFGAVPLIEDEMRRFHEDTGCEARLDARCPTRPPRDVEVALYRIFHEALINVRRHAASARSVTVVLEYGNGSINLRVQDDGQGFDVEAAVQRRRVGGLMSMRRRAENVGGAFDVRSRPGHGTRVSVRVPVNGARKGGQSNGQYAGAPSGTYGG
ncbi:MAG: sensor histidine kinase [Chloroflexi bacterium]|nr:sensor histidine kinase [Chloroflexota bacterium]